MSEIKIQICEKVGRPWDDIKQFQAFIQAQMDRLGVGFIRYGPSDPSKRYYTRLIKELDKYRKTGNAENLINLSSYAMLEYIHPEHPKYHHDKYVESATRAEMGTGKRG